MKNNNHLTVGDIKSAKRVAEEQLNAALRDFISLTGITPEVGTISTDTMSGRITAIYLEVKID